MHKTRQIRYSLIPFLLLFLYSCTQGVIRRNRYGHRTNYRRPKVINNVKKKVALLPLYNESPFGGKDLGVTATAELRKELMMTGLFIIDHNGESLFGSSKEIFVGGGQKLTQVSKKAKLQGINFVLFGRIIKARIREKVDEIGFVRKTKTFSDAKVELRIFDVNSNKEIFQRNIMATVDDSSYRFYLVNREDRYLYRQELLRYVTKVAVRKFIPKLLRVSEKLDWIGRVAKVIGNKIYINAGRSSGINIGDALKVLTEGKEIFDPETGAFIGVSKGEVKGILEIVDYFGVDGAIAMIHSGGSVSEGDFVMLY